jgi:hypothetical protein
LLDRRDLREDAVDDLRRDDSGDKNRTPNSPLTPCAPRPPFLYLEWLWREFRVAVRTREIYLSANGDRWLLARDPDTGRVFVRHEPNLPSGGQDADIEVGAFLIGVGHGPEKHELLRLIGTLV